MIIGTLIHKYSLFITCLKENVIFFSEALHMFYLCSVILDAWGMNDLSLMDLWMREELIFCFVFDFFQCLD